MDLDKKIEELNKNLETIKQAYSECLGALKFVTNEKQKLEKEKKEKKGEDK